MIVAIYFFHRDFTMWELIAQFISPILLSVIVYASSISIKETDIEFWNSTCVSISRIEKHELYEKESYSCDCVTDTETGTVSCNTCYEWVCNSYGPYWYAYNQNGTEQKISESTYAFIHAKWNNSEQFVKTHGERSCKKGDEFEAKWNGLKETYVKFTEEKAYKNKVRFNAVYNPVKSWPEEKQKQVYKYPPISDILQENIIGDWPNNHDLTNAKKLLEEYAGLYGPKSRAQNGQIAPFIFIYKDKSREIAEIQRSVLEGGNKNEFILILNWNSSSGQIDWYDVITFCENPGAKNRMYEWLHQNDNASLEEITRYMIQVLKDNWLRREFTPLNEFIKITPSKGIWIGSLCLCLFINIGLFLFFRYNEN